MGLKARFPTQVNREIEMTEQRSRRSGRAARRNPVCPDHHRPACGAANLNSSLNTPPRSRPGTLGGLHSIPREREMTERLPSSKGGLPGTLKAKSRSRREALAALSASSKSPSRIRNDLLIGQSTLAACLKKCGTPLLIL